MLGTGYLVVAALLAVGGLAMAVVGLLGLRRRLPRNRFAGVRTVNTLRDDETFAVGNQVGGPLSIAAGLVALVAGAAVFAAHGTGMALTLIVLGVVGALVLTVTGGVLGDRAARRVPASLAEAGGGCTGVCAGCDLVAGCGGAPTPENAQP
jgi:uncharacterized membrane protein